MLDEAEACERYREALADALDETGCEDELELGQCPELIRPAGATACTRFSEESLASCEEAIAEYESCADFSRRRCILVSVLDEFSEGCVAPTPPEAGTGASEGGADIPEAGGPAVNDGLDAASTSPLDAATTSDAATSSGPGLTVDAGGAAADAATSSEPDAASEAAALGDAGEGADPSTEDAAPQAPPPDAGPPPVEGEAGADAGMDLPDAG